MIILFTATAFDQTTAILRPVISRKTWCILKLYKITCQMNGYLVITDSGKMYCIHFLTHHHTITISNYQLRHVCISTCPIDSVPYVACVNRRWGICVFPSLSKECLFRPNYVPKIVLLK